MNLHQIPPREIDASPASHDASPARFSRIKAAAWTFSGIGILALFYYRLVTFTPVALDTPGTLRPILYRLFLWFVTLHKYPEQAFSSWSTGAWLLSLVPATLTVLDLVRHRVPPRYQRIAAILLSRELLFAVIAISLVVCRFPSLLENELNPDEGQFIASSHKLFYDTNYFGSVDCGTSGPVNIYPLMLPSIFGLSPDYASSRLISLSVEFLCIWLLYVTVTRLAPAYVARLAVIPLFGAFVVFRHPDMVGYNSEHIPTFLIAVGLYFNVRVLLNPRRYVLPMLLLGLIACAAFFAKMQALPIVCALAAMAAAYVYATRSQGRLWKPPLVFAAGSVPLPLIIAIGGLAAGLTRDFWMAYIVTNGRYAVLDLQTAREHMDFGGTLITDLPPFVEYLVNTLDVRHFLYTFVAMAAAYAFQRSRPAATEARDFLNMSGVALAVIFLATFLKSSSGVGSYLFAAFAAVLLGAACLLISYRKDIPGMDPVRWFGLTGAVLLASALFSVYKAHRAFPHYLTFLFVPVSAIIAWMLIRQADYRGPQRLAFPLLVIVLTVACQSFVWGSQDHQMFRRIPYTVRPLEGPLISEMTRPDEPIEVWGWTVRPYLGAGRVPATRDTNMANFFRWPEISAYYRERFLRDMRQTPPALFIDAVGPTSWAFNDRRWNRFEEFPEIKAYIDAHYVHVTDLFEQRYFLRRDLAGSRPLPLARDPNHCERPSVSCLDTPSEWLRTLPPVRLPGHASIEMRFTPAGAQADYAIVVSNEASRCCEGFHLYHTGGDAYRFVMGVGSDWIFSRELNVPPAKPTRLWIELNGSVVTIWQDGQFREQLYLPRPLVDSTGPTMVGSSIGGARRFAGSIQFFQIADLEKQP